MAEVRVPGRPTQGGITPSSLGRGTRLGRYELLAPIGVGGMAKVWAARQSGYGGFAKIVAIKTILPHLSRESDFQRLFVDEARVASLVHHTNVCEIFELSEEGSVLFLVMEWVDGDSLIKLLKPATTVIPFDPRLAARIGADTCAGLHAAHTQIDHEGKPLNIVHRDVSPHNILLSAEGMVKVTDFGVAKAAGQTHDQTVAGQLKGKLEYMSPEQITGARVDGRTDVFGMGGVIFEATTGHQPFESAGDLEAMTKIVEGRLAPPSSFVRGYPRELEDILMCSMATDPARRFASADDMRIALDGWLSRSGPPVTHADVATLLRSRVGPKMDERLDRIRAAMSAGPGRNPSHTPSASGVIPTNKTARVAPVAPGLPQKLVVPNSYGSPRSDAARSSPRTIEDLDDLDGPDSSPNMDTVVDLQLADLLDPSQERGGAPAIRPNSARMEAPQQRQPQHHQSQQEQQHQQPQYQQHQQQQQVQQAPPWATEQPYQEPPAQVFAEEEQALDPRQYIMAAVIGVVVAVVLGGAAFFAWRYLVPEPPRPPASQSQQHSTASPDPRPASPAPHASSWTAAPSGSSASSSSVINFRVTPSTATLFLDGRPLPASGRTVARLQRGRSSTVVVHADGFVDETMQLDDSVSGNVDVVLTPRTSK